MHTWDVRGPARKLRREEKRLWAKVRQALWNYEPLRASHAEITIDVAGRNVTLSGRVRTLPQKILAEVLVKRLDEVESLTNALVADAEAVRAVADALAADPRIAPYVPLVQSQHGVVTLRGEVPSEAHRQAAVDIAAGVPLVVAVRDRLAVSGTDEFLPYAPSRMSDPLVAAKLAVNAAGATGDSDARLVSTRVP